jgi:polygalacturonase
LVLGTVCACGREDALVRDAGVHDAGVHDADIRDADIHDAGVSDGAYTSGPNDGGDNGDAGEVPDGEPRFPPTCNTLVAQLAVVDGEPSSETELDTTRIQSALDGCVAGKSVELAASSTSNAFLTGPITIPNGVTLVVDAGVTLFASRNPADYQIGVISSTQEACGTLGSIGNGCRPLISSTSTTGAGVMGYGVIDGRGPDDLIVGGVVQSDSWYSNTVKTAETSPNKKQSNPKLISTSQANDFTLYKITLKNSPFWTVLWAGRKGAPVTSGLTVWGIKIISPHNIDNTDGIDPSNNVSNVNITNSFISNGDDMVALSSYGDGEPVSHVVISHMHTYSGFGVSIGAETFGGISDVLVDTLDQNGYYPDVPNGLAGIQIKSSADTGGLVNNITYQNICQQNESFAVRIAPVPRRKQSVPNTNSIPTYTNLVIRNMTVLASPDGSSGRFNFQGYDANHVTTLTLDNLNVLGTPSFTSENTGSPPEEYVAFTLGPGPVNPASFQSISGPGISYAGTITDKTEAAYPCSSANFQLITGELSLSTATVNNLQRLSAASSTTFTLKAVVQPASAEYAALTNPITFYDGDMAVGTAAIGGNGTLATLTLSNVAAGTHIYSAKYPADINYPADFAFGSVMVKIAP